jgi:hypothetical protein
MRHLPIFILTLFLTIACTKNSDNNLILDYKFIGQPDYFPVQKYDLRYDKLILAFAGNFDNDTVNVKYQDTDSTIIMKTDEVTGLAYDLRLGAIKNSNLLLKINDHKAVKISIDKDNQLFLIEKTDSLLRVRSRYYLPGFY